MKKRPASSFDLPAASALAATPELQMDEAVTAIDASAQLASDIPALYQIGRAFHGQQLAVWAFPVLREVGPKAIINAMVGGWFLITQIMPSVAPPVTSHLP